MFDFRSHLFLFELVEKAGGGQVSPLSRKNCVSARNFAVSAPSADDAMRLRSRGGTSAKFSELNHHTANPPLDDNAGAPSRAVLGDVSNKKYPTTAGEGVKATKKTRASTNRALASHTDETEHNENKTNKRGRDSTRECEVFDQKSSNRGSSARSSSSGRRPKKSSRANSTGTTFTGDQDIEPRAKKSKRARGGTPEKENGIDADNNVNDSKGVARVRSRSRKRAQDHRPERHESAAELASNDEQQKREDVGVRNLNDDFLIPPEYRLQRASYDGTNHTLGVASHDSGNEEDVLHVTSYVTDLFQYLFNAEARSRPNTYMEEQRDINAKMRAILVDWLVEVHMKFRLVPETLYLCVNIIDRYCNLVPVARSKLQLVGVTALLIACKYEEIYPPEVRDCVYITDRAYHRQEVLDMEQDMLQRLRFKITVPTAYPFLLRFLNLTKASPLTRFAAHYYMERTLQEHDLLLYRPSLVCAAAVILALNNPHIRVKEDDPKRQRPGMPRILLEYTGFDEREIFECATLIARKVREEPVTASRRQLVSVKRKYGSRRYLQVSTDVEQPNERDIQTAIDEKA